MDGSLPDALDKFCAAVAGLVDPAKKVVGGIVMTEPSIYEQLLADVPAQCGDPYVRKIGSSRPPIFVDAADLQIVVDCTVRQWQPHGKSTPERLRRLAAARYRPQDCDTIKQRTADVLHWTAAIERLLRPERVKTISAPCPACGARYVYRMNKAGERVRQAALQIVASVGCTCTRCATHWTPDKYLLLCRVLGFKTPAGVLPE